MLHSLIKTTLIKKEVYLQLWTMTKMKYMVQAYINTKEKSITQRKWEEEKSWCNKEGMLMNKKWIIMINHICIPMRIKECWIHRMSWIRIRIQEQVWINWLIMIQMEIK